MSIGQKVRSKRVIIPAVAALAIIGVGAATWAVVADGDDPTSEQRSEAGDAALAEIGGGRVLDVDADDDDGGARVFEVDAVDSDGVEWDITLDEDYQVLVADADDHDGARGSTDDPDNGDAGDGAANGAGGTTDDAPISEEERAEVVAAAEAAVPGGTATDVDRSDDRGEAWEVEVRDGDGLDWDVTLDADLGVLSAVRD